MAVIQGPSLSYTVWILCRTADPFYRNFTYAAIKNYLTSGMASQEDEQGMDDGVNNVADTD